MDDPAKRGVQDRTRIALNQEHEVRYWTKRLGVNRLVLHEAVDAIGNHVDDVETYLKSRLPGHETPEDAPPAGQGDQP